MFKHLPKNIQIVEVGPRDGLQNESALISTADKFTYIEKLVTAGIKVIEVTSFVRPDAVKQMSDAKTLFPLVNKAFPNLRLPCLVPNMKGYETAREVGVNEIALFSATSSAFTQKNINCTVAESFTRMQPVAQAALQDNKRLRGYISTAFGCPYQGESSVQALESVIEQFFALGVHEISIGDTIGVATPKQVDSYLSVILKKFPKEKLAMHFHDTRGMALVNILTSLQHGIEIYDASSGGLGGCPYAKGATGNVATEDLYYLFDSLGIETGIDLPKLTEASSFILNKIQKTTPSKFLQAYLKGTA